MAFFTFVSGYAFAEGNTVMGWVFMVFAVLVYIGSESKRCNCN